MAEIKIYKNEDYTATSITHDGGVVDYFIKYHFSTTPQEIKVTAREYALYVGEFRKPHERHRNEKRRHIHNGDLKEIDESKPSLTPVTDFSKQSDSIAAVETILKSCTPTQRRRYSLHHKYGYTLDEIAEIEKCVKSAVFKSIFAVDEKIKKYFLIEGEHLPDF